MLFLSLHEGGNEIVTQLCPAPINHALQVGAKFGNALPNLSADAFITRNAYTKRGVPYTGNPKARRPRSALPSVPAKG